MWEVGSTELENSRNTGHYRGDVFAPTRPIVICHYSPACMHVYYVCACNFLMCAL